MDYFPEGLSNTVSGLAQGTAQVAQGTVSALVNYFELGKEPKKNLIKAIRRHNHKGFTQKISRLDCPSLRFTPAENPLFVACQEAIAQKDNPEAHVACMQIINHILDDDALRKLFDYEPVILSENERYLHLVHMALVGADYELASHLISRDFTFKDERVMYSWAMHHDNEDAAIFLMTMGYPLVNHRALRGLNQHNPSNSDVSASHEILMTALHCQRYQIATKCLELVTQKDRQTLHIYYHAETPLDFVIERILHHLKIYSAVQDEAVFHHIHGLFTVLVTMRKQGFTTHQTHFESLIMHNMEGLALLTYLLACKHENVVSFVKDKPDNATFDLLWAVLHETDLFKLPETFSDERSKRIETYARVLPIYTRAMFNLTPSTLNKLSTQDFDALKSIQDKLDKIELRRGLMNVYLSLEPFSQKANDLLHRFNTHEDQLCNSPTMRSTP